MHVVQNLFYPNLILLTPFINIFRGSTNLFVHVYPLATVANSRNVPALAQACYDSDGV